jgi:type II secretory pathway predicted ATPase ExeA
MFKEYYGFTGDPFRLSPDHNFCYRYPSFAKGRAYMQYALQAAEGFVVVTGQPGMGKTTLINDLLSDYGPRDYTIATLVNTMLEANEVLRSAAYEFGLNVEHMDTATVLQRLKQLFIQAHNEGRPPLLVVDEAQNLTLNALEELRMLTNLQLNGKPLLQIFLVGQEELREKLQDPSLEQLRQRVTAASHLHALDQEQVAAYIIHRLKVVGWEGNPKLKSSLLPVIDIACAGVPRRINQFCSRLLLHGAVEQKTVLDASDAQVVLEELSEERLSPRSVSTSSVVHTEYLGLGVGEDHEPPADAELLQDPDEERKQRKVVMPPPKISESPQVLPMDPLPAVDLPPMMPPPPMPSAMKPAPARGAAAPPAVGATAHPGPGYAATRRGSVPPGQAEPIIPRPSYPHPNMYPGYRRGPRVPWLPIVVVLFLVLGAGFYAWLQMDRESAEDLLGLEIDSYISYLQNEGQEEQPPVDLSDIVPIERADPAAPDAADPAAGVVPALPGNQ